MEATISVSFEVDGEIWHSELKKFFESKLPIGTYHCIKDARINIVDVNMQGIVLRELNYPDESI